MRVAKTDLGMLGELEDQLQLLEEHINRAKQGEARSIKIIAPILRDLVCAYRSNPKPLLFRLANRYSFELVVERDVPPVIQSRLTLHELLEEVAFMSGTENIRLTNLELLKVVADQTSVAHTDNGIDPKLYAAMGWPEQKTSAYSPHAVAIIGIGEMVLQAGNDFLSHASNRQDG